jgi:hypothetical protein
MWQQLHAFLVLSTVLLSETCAMNLPQLNVTSLAAISQRDCFPHKSFQRQSLLIDDCILAINELPQIYFDGSFHNGAPYDPFRLPLERTTHTCTIDIELDGSSADSLPGGWGAVARLASELAYECAYEVRPTSPRRWCRGGAARLGKNSRIIVSLRYARGRGATGTLTSSRA